LQGEQKSNRKNQARKKSLVPPPGKNENPSGRKREQIENFHGKRKCPPLKKTAEKDKAANRDCITRRTRLLPWTKENRANNKGPRNRKVEGWGRVNAWEKMSSGAPNFGRGENEAAIMRAGKGA